LPAGGLIRHVPVLLSPVLDALKPKDGERYIDATFGAGGYSRAILDAAQCEVLALDRDPSAITEGRAMEATYGGRLTLAQRPFGELDIAMREKGWNGVEGVVFDLGVSSMQLDEAERGFSFMQDGPLDMRMSAEGLSAAEVVNTYPEAELADILYKLGEERRSRAIAAAILRARSEQPIARTGELASIVSSVLGRKPGDAKHPATRTFQALRLYVNDELGELERGLGAAERALAPGGRLLAVSFHSLEDRIVKRFLAERSGNLPQGSRFQPEMPSGPPPTFACPNRHGVAPDSAEIEDNPRARSARLRWAIRTSAPA
jgi:16S rRNA (cytosine1402-N4)-methyltransferase